MIIFSSSVNASEMFSSHGIEGDLRFSNEVISQLSLYLVTIASIFLYNFAPSLTTASRTKRKEDLNSHSVCEDAKIEDGSSVGPFARLRPMAHVGPGAKVGNFVEMKKATLGAGSKINHLSYVGDAVIGESANIGAGTITCNYDGFSKHKTTIGAGAFIGSNTALVAPVSVGQGAIVGAGSVITKDVPEDAVSVARGKQIDRLDAAARVRSRKKS